MTLLRQRESPKGRARALPGRTAVAVTVEGAGMSTGLPVVQAIRQPRAGFVSDVSSLLSTPLAEGSHNQSSLDRNGPSFRQLELGRDDPVRVAKQFSDQV